MLGVDPAWDRLQVSLVSLIALNVDVNLGDQQAALLKFTNICKGCKIEIEDT